MKYLKIYVSKDDAIGTSAQTPYVGTVSKSNKVVFASKAKYGDVVNLVTDEDGFFKPEIVERDTPPSNEIWYTTTNDTILTHTEDYLDYESTFGNRFNDTDDSVIVSHTYESGKGILRFNCDVTKIFAESDSPFDYGFFTQSNLKTIILPDSVTELFDYAFENCSGLVSVRIPGSIANIGWNPWLNVCYDHRLDIIFNGTKSQWEAVTENVSKDALKIVHCTDGDIDYTVDE